jgi:hypothetical protein
MRKGHLRKVSYINQVKYQALKRKKQVDYCKPPDQHKRRILHFFDQRFQIHTCTQFEFDRPAKLIKFLFQSDSNFLSLSVEFIFSQSSPLPGEIPEE